MVKPDYHSHELTFYNVNILMGKFFEILLDMLIVISNHPKIKTQNTICKISKNFFFFPIYNVRIFR